MNKKDKYLNIHYSGLHAAYWFINVAVMVFMIMFLRNRHFSDGSIGVLQMIKYLMSVVSQIVVANLVDRYKNKITLKQVICIMCMLSFITTVLLSVFHMGFIGTAICFAIFGCTINGVYPYINAMAAAFTGAGRKLEYNFARGIGALTWAVGSIIVSALINGAGLECVLWVQAVMVAALFAGALTIDDTPELHAKAGNAEKAHTYWFLFVKYPHYSLFLAASIFMFIATNLQTAYMTDVVAKLGGGNTELGYIEFMIAIYEVIAALIFTKVSKKLSIETILMLCPVFAFIQSVLMAVAPNLVWLGIINVFYIFGVGIYWTTSVIYVTEAIPGVDGTKGQALVNVASVGIGGIIGSLIGGYIIEHYGIDRMLLLNSCSVAVSIILMFIAMTIGKTYKLKAIMQ